LHEDNRYFNSGRQGFWPRTLTSGILARHGQPAYSSDHAEHNRSL